MKFVPDYKKFINYVNTLAIVLSTGFVPSHARAEAAEKISEISKQRLGRPALVDGKQLKALVTEANEFSKGNADDENEIDMITAEELYIVKVLDPYADVNKVFSDVNSQVYRLIKTPADIYATNPVLTPVRLIFSGIGNVVSNVDELLIGTSANLIAGRPADAGKTFARSLFNLPFGLAGMIDTASIIASEPTTDQDALNNLSPTGTVANALSFNVEFLKQPEIHSFDDALRDWGFGCGFYMVFPVLGPQTARKVIATAAEMPFRVDTYVPGASVLRIVGGIDQALDKTYKAKIIFEDVDLSTEGGKEIFYKKIRSATLESNKCIDEKAVREFAEKNGKTISDDFN
jgi:ABC-type transporter lipoprotein component MlaA